MLYLYLFVSLLLIATIVASSYLLTVNYSSNAKIDRTSRALFSHIYSINASVLKSKTYVKDYIISNDVKYITVYDSILTFIDEELQALTAEVDTKTAPIFPLYVKQDFFRFRNNVLSLNKKNIISLHSARMTNTDDSKSRQELYIQYINNIQPDFNEFIDRNSISVLKTFSSHFQNERLVYSNSIKNSLLYLIGSSTLLFLLLLSFVWYIRRAIINPIKYLVETTNKVSSGSYDLPLAPKFWRNEIRNYIDQFSKLINTLKSIDEDNQYAKWIRDGENLLYNQLISTNNINELYSIVTSELCKRTNANSSVLYVLDSQTDKLILSQSYAAPPNRITKTEFKLNEGFVGEYALKSDITIISDIPKDYYNITSSLGRIDSVEIAFIPLRIDNSLFGILEVATIKKLSEFDKEYFRRASRIIASGLHIFLYRN